MASLSDRWAAMDAEQLRTELMNMFSAQGVMQATLYEKIRELEQRIHQQRQMINRMAEERHDLGVKLAEARQKAADPYGRGIIAEATDF